MKKASQPTIYILLQAATNSEWDSCEYAILHLTKNWRKNMAHRRALFTPLKQEVGFAYAAFYDFHIDFFIGSDQQDTLEMLADGTSWTFIETTEEEIHALPTPDNSLDDHSMRLFADGMARFIAYGKHTGEEFFTGSINIDKLMNRYPSK